MTLENKSQEASPGDDTLNVPRIPPHSPSRSFPIPIRRVQSFDASSRRSKAVSPTLSDDSFSPSSPSSPFRKNESRNERGKHQNRVASVPNLRAMRRRLSHGSYFHAPSHANSTSSSPTGQPFRSFAPSFWPDGQFRASCNARIASPLSDPTDQSGTNENANLLPPIAGPNVIDSVWLTKQSDANTHTPEYSEEPERSDLAFPTSPVLQSNLIPSPEQMLNLGFPRLSSLSLQSSSPPPVLESPISPRVMSDSPPKTRSNIALPPRSGYSISDDSDSVRSESESQGSGKSSTDSSSENEGDGAVIDDDDGADDVDASEERIRKWQMSRSLEQLRCDDNNLRPVFSSGVTGEDDTSNDADAEDEREERVLQDFSLVSPRVSEEDGINVSSEQEDASDSMDDGLNCLERIFLFAKSDLAYHRVLVSRCLADWIKDVDLTEAVEYVIPLLNGLATDELEVSAVFAPELGRLMWFFFRNCPLQELSDLEPDCRTDDADDEIMPRPRISLSTFTPLLCSLLLNPNTAVSGATQASIVEYFLRSKRFDEAIHSEQRQGPEDYDGFDDILHADLVEMGTARDDKLVPMAPYNFDEKARSAVLNELFEHVAIAIACMEENSIETASSQNDRMSFDEEPALGRMMSVNLLAAITMEGGFSRKLLIDRVVPEITSWPQDPAFFVRKEVAAAIGIVGKALNSDAPDELSLSESSAPARLFEALSRVLLDHIWQVRQAACYSLPGVFAIQPRNNARRENLLLIMRALKQDISPNVQLAAFEMIGEIIYLFHDDENGVPDELVRLFMGQPMDAHDEGNDVNEILTNSDYALIVAFNFPAVVLTLGPKQWYRLRELYKRLTTHAHNNVRNSLAASLHQMAKLIGSKAACQDLIPVSDQFFHDTCVEVTATMLEHMDEFWLMLPVEAAREQLLRVPALWLTDYAHEWRLRQSIAAHIPALIPTMLLGDEDGCLITLSLLALNDPVNALRNIGIQCVPITYRTFREHDETIADGFLSMLCDMAHASTSRQRTIFLNIVQSLLEHDLSRERFERLILPCLLELAADGVSDVNIALARTVQQVWLLGWYNNETMPAALRQVVATLLIAPTLTVQEFMQSLDPPILTHDMQPMPLNKRHPLVFGPAPPILDNTIIPMPHSDESEHSTEVL